jgi:sialic acid synthase SpsE
VVLAILFDKFGVIIHKIGIDNSMNKHFLEQVVKTDKIVILSTGMCTFKDVKKSFQTILKFKRNLKINHVLACSDFF